MIRGTVWPAVFAIVIAGCGGDGGSDSGSAADTAAREAVIQAALASAERTAEMRDRDEGRRPADVLLLSGIERGDHVIELGSFGLYYSTILAAVVGPEGRLDMIDPPFVESFGGDAARAFAAEHDNVEFHLVDYAQADFPDDVDIVFNILFYHDLMGAGIDLGVLNAKVFEALKPGGAYLVVDHKAEDGSGRRDTEALHRIGKETIIEEVTEAGFELEVDSDLLANPDDPRTGGVFTLRGATDRAVLLFRKPD